MIFADIWGIDNVNNSKIYIFIIQDLSIMKW